MAYMAIYIYMYVCIQICVYIPLYPHLQMDFPCDFFKQAPSSIVSWLDFLAWMVNPKRHVAWLSHMALESCPATFR